MNWPRSPLRCRPTAITLLVCVVAPVLTEAGDASSTPAVMRPATVIRTYAGAIISGTGRYVNARGTMAIRLTLTQTAPSSQYPTRSGSEYAVTVSLSGARCPRVRHRAASHPCLALSGEVAGSAIKERTFPDLPPKLRIGAASGRISNLGAVTAQGALTGTGYIRKGRRKLWTAFTGSSGTVSIGGHGPSIGGFQEP